MDNPCSCGNFEMPNRTFKLFLPILHSSSYLHVTCPHLWITAHMIFVAVVLYLLLAGKMLPCMFSHSAFPFQIHIFPLFPLFHHLVHVVDPADGGLLIVSHWCLLYKSIHSWGVDGRRSYARSFHLLSHQRLRRGGRGREEGRDCIQLIDTPLAMGTSFCLDWGGPGLVH